MKRKVIAFLTFIGLSLAALAQNPVYERQCRLQRSQPVSGGVGIEQFFVAILHGVHDCYKDITSVSQIDEGTVSVDKQNGYVRWYIEGAGSMLMQCCYWNRSDGSKLVGFYYDEHDLEEDDRISYQTNVQFYTFNEATQCLDAVNEPWGMELQGPGHLLMELPKKGKDVEYRFGHEQDMGNFNILKWNGFDFRPKGTGSATIRPGKHLLKLQWIEGVNAGSCQIKATGKKGEYTVTGSHYNKSKTDWLKIDGTLTMIDAKRLRFKGTIKTRISHIANGEEQIRCGNMDFLASGSRKYWRLQQMFTPGDITLDYVDIFF